MPQQKAELNDLIFYAIDKASPYALAQFPQNDNLDKIEEMSLTQLSIPHEGRGIMWLWINAHSGRYGASPVAPNVTSKATTVAEVKAAVYATL